MTSIQQAADDGDFSFLLTRPLRDVTECSIVGNYMTFISTHTPLAGRDGYWLMIMVAFGAFLLTRPLRDVTQNWKHLLPTLKFLLTRPLRDVTGRHRSCWNGWTFLLTRPLRDVTLIELETTDALMISLKHNYEPTRLRRI